MISEVIFTINLLLTNFFVMRIILYFIFSFLFLNSCTNKDKDCHHSVIYLSLNNKELESAIIEYRLGMEKKFAKEIAKGDSVYVGVYMKDISDSVKRYVLSPVYDYYSLRVITPFFICKVDSKDVFFMIESGQSYYYGLENYFKLSEEEKWYFIKRYFPRRYEQYQRDGHFSNSAIIHSKDCYLTFYKDTLIDKTYRVGLWRDKIRVKINGEEHRY